MNVIQYKFKLKNVKSFIKNAKSNGVNFGPISKSSYTYFQVPTQKKGEYITLRTKQTSLKKSVDVKIKKNSSHKYKYIESSVQNLDAIKQILTYAGSKPIITFHKNRRTYKNSFIRIDLDIIKELSPFLEVKFFVNDTQKVHEFIKNLRLEVSNADYRSNIQIYIGKKHIKKSLN